MVQYKSIFFITFLGLVVFFSGCTGKQVGTPTPTLTPTPTVTVAQTVTVPTFPEATPTGNQTLVKLDSNRGFIPNNVTIKAGDEIVWDNYDTNTVTLASNDGFFDAQVLAYHQQYRYIFKKSGAYTFYLEQNKNLSGTIIVEAQPIPTATLPPTVNELPPGSLYVDARMKKPAIWGIDKYELNSLQVQMFNQQSVPLSITAQIVNSGQVLEENTFTLESQGSSYSFTNQKTHFINNTNVTLRLLIQGYQPVEYNFTEVNSLS
ncbi:Cupredoxin-like domain protein [uncultured archaeon]|nr:Cupredoxin-like domain protein [uncultured archaeon]